MRRAGLVIVVFLAGCQSLPEWRFTGGQSASASSSEPRPVEQVNKPRRLVLNTQPAGGIILIEPLGREVAHGGSVELMAGSYQLVATLPGYRAGGLQLQVSQQSDSMVVVPLGEGFARVIVESQPLDATLSVDGNQLGMTPFSAEISAGKHQIELRLDGFEPVNETVVFAPDSQRKLFFELHSSGGLAALEIDTNPSGGLLRLDGRLVGHAPLVLTDIPPKRYQLTGELFINGQTRLLGKADLELFRNQRRKISLQLTQRETRFGQQESIGPAEHGRGFIDSGAPILDPVSGGVDDELVTNDAMSVSVEMAASLKADLADPRFSGAVYSLLRAGDNIEFFQHGQPIGRLQKLAITSKSGLSEQLTALGIATQQTPPETFTAQQKRRLKEFVFLVYGQRGGYPLLALNSDQLPGNQLSFRRQPSDGEVVILASGDLRVEGYRPVMQRQGLRLFRLPADSGEVQINWQAGAPQVLVTGSDSPKFGAVPVPSLLGLGEKRFLQPLAGRSVEWLNEITAGPGVRGWREQRLSAYQRGTGKPLAPVIEIGPHERAGAYQRVWVVGYRYRGGLSQRQFSLQYQVGSDRQVFVSDQFLRRDGFAKTKLPEVRLPRGLSER